MITIKEYLEQNGYVTATDDTYSHIQEWEDWYSGFVKDFHEYNVYNGVQMTKQERYRLNMAKTISEDWAGLILNEKVEIHTGTDFDETILY